MDGMLSQDEINALLNGMNTDDDKPVMMTQHRQTLRLHLAQPILNRLLIMYQPIVMQILHWMIQKRMRLERFPISVWELLQLL